MHTHVWQHLQKGNVRFTCFLEKKWLDGHFPIFSYLLRKHVHLKNRLRKRIKKYLCFGMAKKKHHSKPSKITFASLLHTDHPEHAASIIDTKSWKHRIRGLIWILSLASCLPCEVSKVLNLSGASLSSQEVGGWGWHTAQNIVMRGLNEMTYSKCSAQHLTCGRHSGIVAIIEEVQ